MKLYLNLLDHAVQSTAESLRDLRREERKAEDKRDAFRLSLAIHQAHLAVEKLLKHVVATIDPYLLLEQASSKLLRELRKEVLALELPSILASKRYLASSNAEQAWAVLQEVVAPPLAADTTSAFEAALKALTSLRNQSQHGELHSDTADVISAIERVFSKLPEVASVICPEFLRLLQERHPHQYAELRAIEAAVDAAWWTLREQLSKGRRIVIPISIHVTSRPNVPTFQLSISRADKARLPLRGFSASIGESELTVFAELESDRVSGFFARMITAEEADERNAARREVVRRRVTMSTSKIPVVSLLNDTATNEVGLLSNVFRFGQTSLHDPIHAALHAAYEREQEYIKKYGVPALEEGAIRLDTAPAWLTVPLGAKSNSHLTGDVLLQQCTLALGKRKPRGQLTGLLLPRKGTKPVDPILVRGKVWLTHELVVRDNTSETLSVGSVIRYLRGEMRLILDKSGSTPTSP